MSRPLVQFNDYVSLAVMLLMAAALVTGQADVSANAAADKALIAPISIVDDRIMFNFDGHIGDEAMKISIAVAGDLSHFRGEDE